MSSLGRITALLLAAFAVQAQMAPKPFAAGETRGQIVDAASGAPIEGVVVVGRWEWRQYLRANARGGLANLGKSIHIGEAVSAADGRFTIAGWGPTTMAGEMEGSMPRLLAFKAGYEPLGQTSGAGTTLRLKKFAGAPEDYARLIAKFQDGNDGLSWTVDENSAATPKMVMALHRERVRLGADGTAILGADRMPGRSGEGHLVPPEAGGIIWVEWTMRRADGAAGTRRVVQTMPSARMGSHEFHISPWILPGPPVAGWEIDPSVNPMVRAYANGYQHSADVRWEEKGGTIGVTKLDASREPFLAELRRRRTDIDGQLAQGDRAEALVLQEAMFSNFYYQCATLTPDLQAGLCFDANSDVGRVMEEAARRFAVKREAAEAQQRALVRPKPTRLIGGFTIEPTAR